MAYTVLLGRRLCTYTTQKRPVLISSSLRRGATTWSKPIQRPNGLKGRLASSEATTVKGTVVGEAGATWSGDRIGRAVLGGASLFGIGSLCYYGMGLSNETGAIDRSMFWSAEVRQRINKTYTYFASGLGMTALAAYGASRATGVMRFMTTRPVLSMIVCAVGTIGSSILCHSIPYTSESLPLKVGSFALFSSIMGATLAPVALMAGPLVARAAMYTAAVVGGLSLTAATAPSEKYLHMSGPLSIGLGVVLVASIGGMFASPGGALFSGLHAIYMYGGLVLFGGFMLYDTQQIIRDAETKNYYDPVNHSIGIYLDTINIFVRILMLLSSGSGNRRR